ncbi:MAG TPA: AAA family ATPase [Blastocatellia bacterium]|jgi:predicted ATPase/DNA-binding winged helix-turn-helix (wHTH) protein|nr:AAA family ATPase [Blastocatellia bacterium]
MAQLSQEPVHFNSFFIPGNVDLLYQGGRVVPLEPRAVRVLRYLAQNHERVVSKEELLEAVWPDVFTTDGVLKRAVSQARRALGDNPDNSRFIATYHGRGYRFIAPVSSEPLIEYKAEDSTDAPPAEELPPALQLVSANRSEGDRAGAWMPVDPDYNQLVGREAEITSLQAEYRRSLAGEGHPVFIIGEMGIGKTQLARAFLRWGRGQGALCLYARFFDYQASRLAPYEVFLDLLRTALGSPAIDSRNTAEATIGLCGLIEQQLGITLPEELFAGAAGADSIRARDRGTPTSEVFRAVAPISQCFVRLSLNRPLVIVFDDLQWADEASREVIGYLLRTAKGEPLMILGLARGDEKNDFNHPLSKWLRSQASYRSFTSLELKPLNRRMCGATIDAVFGGSASAPAIPETDLETLHRITAGNPFFLTEMLRLLIAEGAIEYIEGERCGWQWRGIKDLRLPESIVMTAEDKLDRLSPTGREVLECASVIGDEFRVDTLARMCGREEEEIEQSLSEGIERGALSERGLSAGNDCRFYHTILRQVLYDGLSFRRRKRLHERAASALETVYSRDVDRVAEAISTHWEAADDLLRALDWSLRAWKAAKARWDWNQAVCCIERARRVAGQLESSSVGELKQAERLNLLLALGETFYSVGRLKESESAFIQAVELARSLDDKGALAGALLGLGQTKIARSSYSEAGKPISSALQIFEGLGSNEGAALALMQLGNIQAATGNYEMAIELIGRALERVPAEGAIAAVGLGILGWARTLQGYFREGAPLLERAADYFDSVGDVGYRALLLRRLHWAHLSRGQYEAAIHLAERARDDYRRIGDVRGEAKLNLGIGQARLGQGLLEEAINLLNASRDRFRAIGETHMEAESFWLLGRAHCEKGSYDEAAAMLARALILARAVGDRDDEFRVLTDAARLSLAERDPQGALRAADEAVAIAEDLRNRDGLGTALVERARALLEMNEPEEARETAERAINLLDETESAERWRGYHALARTLEVMGEGGRAESAKALEMMRKCVALLEDVRDQLDVADSGRRLAVTRARSNVVRDLYAILERRELSAEAKLLARRWMIDGDAPHLSLAI